MWAILAACLPVQEENPRVFPKGDGGSLAPLPLSVPVPLPVRPNPIPAENALAGTREWRIRKGANQQEIEGYALQETVSPSGKLEVAVNAPISTHFSWRVYRLG